MLSRQIIIILIGFTVIAATEIDTENAILQNNNELKIAPIQIDSNAIGSLDISTYPTDVEVYVNGVPVGKGNKVITKLKPGKYIINAKYRDKTFQKEIYIETDKCTMVGIKLGRRFKFVIEPSVNYTYVLKTILVGTSLDLGFQNYYNYFGIDYNWNFFNEPDKYFLGGSGFKWLYLFHINDAVTLSPGVNVGFWYAEFNNGNNTSQRNQFDGLALLYGGLTAKLFAGNNHVSFTFEQSLLYGTSIAYMGRIGFNLKL